MFDWLKRSTPSLPGKPSRVTVASPRAYESNTIVLIDTSYSVGQEMVDFAVRKGLPAIAGSMLSASTRIASPRAYESNTIVLIDTSYSVGQEMVDFAVRKGLPAIAGSMLSASTRNGIVYNLGVMTFASDVREVVPMTDVRAFDERRLPDDLAASGVTMMEKALWRALAEIDKAKARQDRERIARAGSLIVVVTDGCPTDEDGARKDLSPYLVRELEIDKAKARQDRERIARAGSLIVVVTDGCPTDEDGARKDLSPYLVRELADRNRTRSCETFAIGLGEVDDDVLRQVGPATSQVTRDGESVEIPHAVCYLGDQRNIECWRTVYQLIGEASSSMTGKRAVAYTDDQSAWTQHVDTIRVDDQRNIECWRTVYQLIGEASSSMTGKRAVAYTDDQSAWTQHVDTIRVDPSCVRIVC